MKATLLLFFGLLIFPLQAQQTFNINWLLPAQNADITIEPGDTVVWTWGDALSHSVVSNDTDAPGDFGSTIMQGMGTTYQYTFTQEAVIDYICGVHPSDMFGTITVQTLSTSEKFIKNLKVFPNPAQDFLRISSLIPLQSYTIRDLNGKQVSQNGISGNLVDVDIKDLKSGLYFISVHSDNQSSTTVKFLKK